MTRRQPLLSGVHQVTVWFHNRVTLHQDWDLHCEEPTVELTTLTVPVVARSWAEAHRHIAEMQAEEGRATPQVEVGAMLAWAWLRRHASGTVYGAMEFSAFCELVADVRYRRYEIHEDDPLLDPQGPGGR